METVEVVIRINKNTFDAINELSKFVDGNHIINGYQMKGPSTVGSMITALAKGAVLPKGHDRLISTGDLDVSKLVDSDMEWVMGICDISRVQSMIDNAPTVIEADKDGE